MQYRVITEYDFRTVLMKILKYGVNANIKLEYDYIHPVYGDHEYCVEIIAKSSVIEEIKEFGWDIGIPIKFETVYKAESQ